ncbi:hypothetical protein [Chelatococcus asaccharovorans]|uniref:Uncharacterized protein n=1 Tax=Chelatococcus asaccharovorans TaxID=28210 RepID=A0A2V3U205_9HYPH|nr:hypothetical protein [Chelatococcus asaccharovorans]MBS7702527.1 hypothetical protein [Chelatococcus asaccharovorans]PXW56263.1 hypothetical protein C7450_10812 [Chelatococcus asaccharovorans]
MKLARYDFTVVRGNNRPITFRFKTGAVGAAEPLDLSGGEIVLTLVSRLGLLRKSTGDADGLTVIPSAGALTWQPTLAESRAIPEGRLSTYEIEWRRPDGSQFTLLRGAITGVGGLADD